LSDLAPLLDEAADGAGVARRSAGERVEYLVGDRLVAVREAAGVEFRLRPDVVAAALRTPDATAGPDAESEGPDRRRSGPCGEEEEWRISPVRAPAR
jgi:hypothetical protein